MNAFPYLIPILTCIYLASNGVSKFSTYFWSIVIAWALTALMHQLFKMCRQSSTEYLGSYVVKTEHEDAWTEIRKTKERVAVGKDRRGNTIYKEVEKIKHVHHPDEWNIFTNIDSKIMVDVDFYKEIVSTWHTPQYQRAVVGSDIVGGMRSCQYYLFGDVEKFLLKGAKNSMSAPFDDINIGKRYITITEPHTYKNKVVNSYSVFNFEKISRQDAETYGLFNYPALRRHDQDCIMGRDVPAEVRIQFRLLNAILGALHQFRVFVLCFDASKGVEIAEKQRAYWYGGNKNEFVVCLGINGDGKVEWSHCFSWMDEPTLSVRAEAFFREHEDFDLMAFGKWLRENLDLWKRKEFVEFDYLNVRLSSVQYWTWFALTALLNILICSIGK